MQNRDQSGWEGPFLNRELSQIGFIVGNGVPIQIPYEYTSVTEN